MMKLLNKIGVSLANKILNEFPVSAPRNALLYYINKGKIMVMRPGDTFHVYPGLRHQMQARIDTELFEFSTQHFDSDSYRIEVGD